MDILKNGFELKAPYFRKSFLCPFWARGPWGLPTICPPKTGAIKRLRCRGPFLWGKNEKTLGITHN